jgi:hypothetical protein
VFRERGAFFGNPVTGALCPAFGQFDDVDGFETQAAASLCGALAVPLSKLAVGASLDPSNR